MSEIMFSIFMLNINSFPASGDLSSAKNLCKQFGPNGSNSEKVTKINLRITAKRHAHLQTLTKTSAKFQKDLTKIVGGVVFTRVDAIRDRQTGAIGDGQTGAKGKAICLPTLTGGDIIIIVCGSAVAQW